MVWYLGVDVSGQHIGLVFLGCLILEYGTDGLCRNVGNYKSTLRKNPIYNVSEA